MSSDNYILVRKDEYGKFVVTSESESSEKPMPICKTDRRYDTLDEAWRVACATPSEYGVEFDFPVEHMVREIAPE